MFVPEVSKFFPSTYMPAQELCCYKSTTYGKYTLFFCLAKCLLCNSLDTRTVVNLAGHTSIVFTLKITLRRLPLVYPPVYCGHLLFMYYALFNAVLFIINLSFLSIVESNMLTRNPPKCQELISCNRDQQVTVATCTAKYFVSNQVFLCNILFYHILTQDT